ncbi:YeeE/YedE family integral membrane protein [Glonium stellatum]|uniref:YeeE/YedE family integral membrane protein n=1 Tax=Glonium stellatum TaxID=574774 RepID=A0A8E2F3N4_9PEZI|nr:YeeE/YedE family integral membrane protein [Glonium stellatum]
MFTPIETGIGAFLLHRATSVLLFNNGSVLGVSGMLRQLLTAPSKSGLFFFVGMTLSFLPLKLLPELLPTYDPPPSAWRAALGTFGVAALTGWGTKNCNGCTSGHMLCGLSHLRGRSFIAVGTFFPVAVLTYHFTHQSLLTEQCPTGIPCYTPAYPSSTTTISLLLLASCTVIIAQFLPRLVAYSTARLSNHDPACLARQITQLIAGLTFGLGLLISGMSTPSKLFSFFAFPSLEAWDPSLALVMVFGVLPNIALYQSRGFGKPPQFNESFELSNDTVRDVNLKFIVGAAAFGVAWGLSGVCPGPAVLRAVMQPAWGLLWMGGFWTGGLLAR